MRSTQWWCTPGVSVVVNALRRSFIKADGMWARESRMVIVYYRISRPFFFWYIIWTRASRVANWMKKTKYASVLTRFRGGGAKTHATAKGHSYELCWLLQSIKQCRYPIKYISESFSFSFESLFIKETQTERDLDSPFSPRDWSGE